MLKDVTFQARSGEITTLVGEAGSSKSKILMSLLGILEFLNLISNLEFLGKR